LSDQRSQFSEFTEDGIVEVSMLTDLPGFESLTGLKDCTSNFLHLIILTVEGRVPIELRSLSYHILPRFLQSDPLQYER